MLSLVDDAVCDGQGEPCRRSTHLAQLVDDGEVSAAVVARVMFFRYVIIETLGRGKDCAANATFWVPGA